MNKVIDVFISQSDFDNTMDQAIQNFSYPGFRKGQVPGVLVRFFLKNSPFNDLVQQRVFQKIYEYIQETQEKLLNYSIDKIQHTDKGWNIKVLLSLEPKEDKENSNSKEEKENNNSEENLEENL